MIKIETFLLFLLVGTSLHAQNHYSGQVVDTKNQPIPYAHVQLKGTTLGTITNHDGKFILYVPLC